MQQQEKPPFSVWGFGVIIKPYIKKKKKRQNKPKNQSQTPAEILGCVSRGSGTAWPWDPGNPPSTGTAGHLPLFPGPVHPFFNNRNNLLLLKHKKILQRWKDFLRRGKGGLGGLKSSIQWHFLSCGFCPWFYPIPVLSGNLDTEFRHKSPAQTDPGDSSGSLQPILDCQIHFKLRRSPRLGLTKTIDVDRAVDMDK